MEAGSEFNCLATVELMSNQKPPLTQFVWRHLGRWEYMSELQQYCVIYGHEWKTVNLFYGLALEGKMHRVDSRCVNCGDEEHKIFMPIQHTRTNFAEILKQWF